MVSERLPNFRDSEAVTDRQDVAGADKISTDLEGVSCRPSPGKCGLGICLVMGHKDVIVVLESTF